MRRISPLGWVVGVIGLLGGGASIFVNGRVGAVIVGLAIVALLVVAGGGLSNASDPSGLLARSDSEARRKAEVARERALTPRPRLEDGDYPHDEEAWARERARREAASD